MSSYGFLMYVMEHYGLGCLIGNISASDKAIDAFTTLSIKNREDMPDMLLNAAKYVNQVFETTTDIDACFKRLEEMTYGYILYVLFKGGDKGALVNRYKKDFIEQMHRYPACLDKLPKQFKDLAEEALDDTSIENS